MILVLLLSDEGKIWGKAPWRCFQMGSGWLRLFPVHTFWHIASFKLKDIFGRRALKQRILSYQTPPCHRRPVMLLNVS